MALRTAFFATAFACVASQAVALSCIRPEIERSFNGWVAAEERYYIGVGSLEPTGPLPEIPSGFSGLDPNPDRSPVTASYSFSGRLLDGEDGVPFDIPITVKVSCVASWCGGFPQPGTTGLMALRGVGVMNLTLDMHACPGSLFPTETETTVNKCIRDGRCSVQ